MPIFKDVKELETVFGEFIQEVLVHPIIGPKLIRANMVVQFQYTDPDAQITIDLRNGKGKVIWGEVSIEPDVVFKQSADFSNRFWQGKENVIAALAKRQVTAKGSITKALQLIPVIRPSFRMYPKTLERLGKKSLVID